MWRANSRPSSARWSSVSMRCGSQVVRRTPITPNSHEQFLAMAFTRSNDSCCVPYQMIGVVMGEISVHAPSPVTQAPRVPVDREMWAAGATCNQSGTVVTRTSPSRHVRGPAWEPRTHPFGGADFPRVGPVLGQRIVDWRTEHGRFSSVEELGEVSGIGDKMLTQLRPKVTV